MTLHRIVIFHKYTTVLTLIAIYVFIIFIFIFTLFELLHWNRKEEEQ